MQRTVPSCNEPYRRATNRTDEQKRLILKETDRLIRERFSNLFLSTLHKSFFEEWDGMGWDGMGWDILPDLFRSFNIMLTLELT